MDIKSTILKKESLILILVNLTIFLFFIFSKFENKRLNFEINMMKYEINNWGNNYNKLALNYPLEINQDLLIKDLSGRKFKLSDLLKVNSQTIIFRYNERSCQPCLVEEIENINRGIKSGYNVILICNFIEYSDFVTFCRINKFKSKAYLITEGVFSDNGNEKSNIPYYTKFELNKYDGCYIPNKNYADLTFKWFKAK